MLCGSANACSPLSLLLPRNQREMYHTLQCCKEKVLRQSGRYGTEDIFVVLGQV